MIRMHYIKDLGPEMDGKEVTLAGWVHEVRETGKITFLILRDSTGIVQVIGKKGETDEKTMKALSLPKESVVAITGILKVNKEAKKGFEILAKKVTDLNPISSQIPFEVTGKVPADIDVRLNHRHIDLRRLETAAIFSIQSTILQSFRNFFSNRGFKEIRTPTLVSEATEGGSEVFEVKYFERKAYLAQSPQLYKQLALVGGMDRVFMVVPVFRAEKSNTTAHLTEVTQMDIEVAFADADDVITLLGDAVTQIVKDVMRENKNELELLGRKLAAANIKIITYQDALKELEKKGSTTEFGSDFSREDEQKISELYGHYVIVKDYPTKVRAFYSMPKPDNPELSNSFDFIFDGIEICSGAQRIHLPNLLIEQLKSRGIDPKNFEFYISAFRNGAPPHAGWSIGLERLTMQIVGAKNIREASLFPRDRKRLTP